MPIFSKKMNDLAQMLRRTCPRARSLLTSFLGQPSTFRDPDFTRQMKDIYLYAAQRLKTSGVREMRDVGSCTNIVAQSSEQPKTVPRVTVRDTGRRSKQSSLFCTASEAVGRSRGARRAVVHAPSQRPFSTQETETPQNAVFLCSFRISNSLRRS